MRTFSILMLCFLISIFLANTDVYAHSETTVLILEDSKEEYVATLEAGNKLMIINRSNSNWQPSFKPNTAIESDEKDVVLKPLARQTFTFTQIGEYKLTNALGNEQGMVNVIPEADTVQVSQELPGQSTTLLLEAKPTNQSLWERMSSWLSGFFK
jgi:hypothetical protein